ncbi:hypothetical protein [Azonexus hydrophilus]|uniref:Uncharacterized protein n=1 Tax=Azonexus hydrophilus TaxID=418702 RepID=A0ABZ2XLW2_9RHOO
MSIDQAKKQAKNLRRLLPAFIAAHPDGGKLADFQELVARTHGYPSFHAMSEAHQATNHERHETLGLGALCVSYQGVESWAMYDLDGNPKMSKKMAYGELLLPAAEYSPEDTIAPISEEFDEACDMEGGLTGDFEDYSPQSLKKLLRLAVKLTKQEPAFVDGYAFQVGAYVTTGENRKAINLAEPLVARIFEMIAKCAIEHNKKEMLIPYTYVSNRPFHRLAHGLVLAYLAVGETAKGVALAKRMFDLWPSDNMGFRFIIADPYGND